MINVERLEDEFIEECEELLMNNHDVSGHIQAPLDINWEYYKSFEEAFVAFTLRNENGDLEGILFFVIAGYPHHSSMTMAQQVTFYIVPKARQYSYIMMQESEQWLRELNVDMIVQSARVGTSFCHTLEIRGYQRMDITYIKSLTEHVKLKEA